jgi:thioredoxin-dependent peroxiredoxin
VEAGGFRREYAAFQKAGAAVVGVSTDPQAESDRFRESLSLPFPLVGDPDGAIVRAYGVRWPVVGRARRVTFVIGKDRKVRLAYGNELDMQAHVRRALEAVEA